MLLLLNLKIIKELLLRFLKLRLDQHLGRLAFLGRFRNGPDGMLDILLADLFEVLRRISQFLFFLRFLLLGFGPD